MDEALTGIRGDVAIKIFGDDINTLQELARQVLSVISAVPGAFNAQMEQTSGVPQVQIEINRDELARYGLNVSDLREMIATLVGGTQVSEMIIGQQRFPIALRLPESRLTSPVRPALADTAVADRRSRARSFRSPCRKYRWVCYSRRGARRTKT